MRSAGQAAARPVASEKNMLPNLIWRVGRDTIELLRRSAAGGRIMELCRLHNLSGAPECLLAVFFTPSQLLSEEKKWVP